MTGLLGLPPLPPVDARRVCAALETARATLRTSHDALAATPDSVAHAQWALAMGAEIERMAQMQAVLVAGRRAVMVYGGSATMQKASGRS